MSNELSILALSGLWVCLVLVVQVVAAIAQAGLVTIANPRDDMAPLTGKAARLNRALINSVVALALFAPAVLILHATGGFTVQTLLAAKLFLFARVAYVVVYYLGTPWLRTGVWSVGFLATAWLYLLSI